MECIQIVDKNGNFTGEIKEREKEEYQNPKKLYQVKVIN